MDTTQYVLSGAGAAMFLIGSLPFMVMIWRKQVAPARATWILFVLLDVLGVTTMAIRGTLNGQILMATGTAFITMLLTIFRSGTGGWRRIDQWCFALTGVGAVLLVTTTEEVALAAGCVCGIIATIPELKLAWDNPKSNSRWAWTWFLLSGIPTFLSLKDWSFMSWAQPANFALVQSSMCVLLWVRWRPRKKSSST